MTWVEKNIKEIALSNLLINVRFKTNEIPVHVVLKMRHFKNRNTHNKQDMKCKELYHNLEYR